MAEPSDRPDLEAVTPEWWRRIEALLDAALDLPGEDREAFLRDACGDDEALRAQVAQLLASGQRTGATFDRPAAALVIPTLTELDQASRKIPERVGRYRILRELGRGGMGAVFLAERDDFRQMVALKLVRRGLDLEGDVVRRFLDEREILASLEHPNIARLLDGGVTEDGLPYFAMEYVEGEPVDRYCDRLRLSVDARVRLMGQVCGAVAYAHRRRVVHRDLKPSNILVTEQGTVKLLDFGIAKLLDDQRQDGAVTRTGVRLLTPEYASPEQIRADPVTPASDVYALGVLLYELLTGRSPHLARGRSYQEIERVVLQDAPTQPSSTVRQDTLATRRLDKATDDVTPPPIAALRSTTPERLRRRLRGDLDAIVLQALRKEPDRRYATAETLGGDLERHLGGQPVTARPDAWRYRTAKFAQRHRMSIATGLIGMAAGVLLLLGLALARTAPSAVTGSPEIGRVLAIGRIADHRRRATAELARPLADMLATNLARTPGLRVVSTARMYELMRQAGETSDTSAAALLSAARRAGATAVLEGALYELLEGQLRLDVRLVELASGNLLHAETASGADAFALVDSSTARLVAKFGASVPSGSLADVTTRSIAAYRFYEEGLRAFTGGQHAIASRLFEAALREDSAFALAAYYAARTAPTFQDRWRGYARAVRLATSTTDRERLRITLGWAISTYDPVAKALADSLTSRYPDEIEGQYLAAGVAAGEGRYAEALPYLRRVMMMDSVGLRGTGTHCTAACDAWAGIIGAYQHMDSLPAAEREGRQWIRAQPEASTPWILLAAVLDQRSRPDEALAAYREFAALNPDYDRGPIYMAEHHIWEGKYSDADRLLRDLMQTGTERQRVEAPWYLAISLRQQGRLTEALEAARLYRRSSFDEFTQSAAPPAALMEAQVLFELGRYAVAAALLDSIADVTGPPEAPPSARAKARVWALTHAATARAAMGDTLGLRALVDSVLALGSQSAYGRDRLLHHYVRGLLLTARGEFVQALIEHQRAIISSNMGYTRVNLELGKLFLLLSRPQDAVTILQPALRGGLEASNLYVTRSEIHALLGEAWDASGHPDSAAAHYRVVVRAWNRADSLLANRRAEVAQRLTALQHVDHAGSR